MSIRKGQNPVNPNPPEDNQPAPQDRSLLPPVPAVARQVNPDPLDPAGDRLAERGGKPLTAKDPVCNQEIQVDNCFGSVPYLAERYYMCSAECFEKFRVNPGEFIKA